MSKSCTDANNIKNASYPKVAVYQKRRAYYERKRYRGNQTLLGRGF